MSDVLFQAIVVFCLLLVRVVVCRPQRGVPSSNFHELVVCALLHQLRALAICVLQDADAGRIADCAETVCDDKGGPLVGVLLVEKVVHARLHQALGLVVQRRGGLVEEEDAGPAYDCAGNGDPLLLPATHQAATDANLGIVFVWHLAHKLVRIGYLGSLNDLVPRCRLATLARSDVVVHGTTEQRWFLLDDTDLLAQPHRVEIPDVDAVKGDGASLRVPAVDQHADEVVTGGLPAGRGLDARVVETLDELHGGGLAAAALSDKRDCLAGRGDKVEAAEHRCLALRIGKLDALELDSPLKLFWGDDKALAALLRLRDGLGNRAALGTFLHCSGIGVHEWPCVDGRHPVNEGKDSGRGRASRGRVTRKRRGLTSTCSAETERPQRLHKVVEI
mmetsp:Transcript_7561/g.31175  ORF Transcript_7561/g.31175 Transcript_7561/m.31175 type:complete len:390 (+) Transcript_7561:44-1213(+)